MEHASLLAVRHWLCAFVRCVGFMMSSFFYRDPSEAK